MNDFENPTLPVHGGRAIMPYVVSSLSFTFQQWMKLIQMMWMMMKMMMRLMMLLVP